MTTYYTDFSSFTAGALPAEFTERWNASGVYTVIAGGDDKILKCAVASSSRKICSWNTIDGDANRANIEVLFTALAKNLGALDAIGGVAVRSSGAGGSETGYVCGFLGYKLYIHKYVAGVSTPMVNIDKSLAINTQYDFRFRVNGTSLKARVWPKDTAEPGTWDLDTTDASISAAGWSGVFGFFSAGALECDRLAVATNGDTASFSGGAASATTLSGPGSGTTGVPSSNFTVGADGTITGTVTVTPNDGGDGGTFTPTSVAISSGTPTATFTYTPASTGVKVIGTTNDGGLSNPTSINYTSNAAASTHDPVLSQRMRMSGYNYYGARR